MRKIVLVFAVALLAMPARGFAQDKPVEVNFGGGVSFPVGNLADSFDTGWNGAIGVTFNVNPAVGVQAEYMYQRFGGPDRTFPNADPGITDTILIESNHQLHAGTFNLVVRSTGGGGVGGYFLAGPGIYHRIIQLTTPSVGFATVCDPYWLICYPGRGVDRRHRRRSFVDRLRLQLRRRPDLRACGEVLRRGPLPLCVGPEDHGGRHGVLDQRPVLPDHVRGAVLAGC